MVSFYISYGVLWIIVAVLFAAVFLLYRQHGVLLFHEPNARLQQGPEIDQRLALVYARDIDGLPVELAHGAGKFQFVFFASVKCPVCKSALPGLRAFAEHNESTVETIVICRGQENDVMIFSRTLFSKLRVVPDSRGTIGRRLRIGTTPFALLIDGGGIVRAKGSPASEQEFTWFADRLEDEATIQAGSQR